MEKLHLEFSSFWELITEIEGNLEEVGAILSSLPQTRELKKLSSQLREVREIMRMELRGRGPD